MEFSILKSILKPKILSGFMEEWQPKESPILKYMPFLGVPALQYQIVSGPEQKPLADICAYDTSYPLKSRIGLKKITGDIPPIRVMKKMTETDLNSYMQFKQMRSPDEQAVVALVFGDIVYCWKAVMNRLSWLGFQALSLGIISLTALNNAGIITESNIT
ncbi:unnamed protein product, partial [marine sediment metagenome]